MPTEDIALHPIDILLVEDNPGDARLALEALKDSKIRNVIHVARDGVEALDYMKRRGAFADAATPDLVVLDLNLPRLAGREVLLQVKSDPELIRIPVVFLSISRGEEDVLRSYNLHANCFITKPIDLTQFMKVVHSIEDFWLTIVKLPPKDH